LDLVATVAGDGDRLCANGIWAERIHRVLLVWPQTRCGARAARLGRPAVTNLSELRSGRTRTDWQTAHTHTRIDYRLDRVASAREPDSRAAAAARRGAGRALRDESDRPPVPAAPRPPHR